MDLLILISGKKEIIYKKHDLSSSLTTIKIDEKLLSQPNKIKEMIKADKYSNVFFGTIDNELQRFQFFIFLYLLVFASGKGALIDHYGKHYKTNWFNFILINIPLFVFEVIVSGVAMVYYNIKIKFLRNNLLKRS
jgi:hypothetical protein